MVLLQTANRRTSTNFASPSAWSIRCSSIYRSAPDHRITRIPWNCPGSQHPLPNLNSMAQSISRGLIRNSFSRNDLRLAMLVIGLGYPN